MNFDFENTRRALIAMRLGLDAKSRKGRMCSNIIGMIETYQEAKGDHKARLTKNIEDHMALLSAVSQ